MDTIFLNSKKNSKTSNPYRLLLNLRDKIDLIGSNKYVTLSKLSIHYIQKNIKSSHKSNKFKTSASTWNKEFVLSDGSYSISNISDYFE